MTRRLTHAEYESTVADLLGLPSRATAFPADVRTLGFSNNADGQSVDLLQADDYRSEAARLARQAVRHVADLAPCRPGEHPLVCGDRFIDRWGKRAWRRPLDAGERAALLKVFAAGAREGTYADGIRLVIAVMLQSPPFLYRLEGRSRPAVLSPWETASRLSYLLWGSMPDEVLFAAAESGGLETPEQIEAQARRMLADPRARRGVGTFFREWLQFDKIDTSDKEKQRLPRFDRSLFPMFRAEQQAFVDSVLWREDATLHTLLTAPWSLMNGPLARFYGVTGPAGEAFERVDLDPKQRPGVLTRAGFLAAFAKAGETSPVTRGKFVREQLLCHIPAPPPDDVEIKAPNVDPKLTTRERFAKHMEEVGCRGCHKLMDPIGLAFESFDALGLWRDTENGKPLDLSGKLVATDVDGPFVGVAELMEKLAASDQVRDCVVKQWFRFGTGREETPADACSLEILRARYAASGYKLPELMLALVQTDAFLYRRPGEVSP